MPWTLRTSPFSLKRMRTVSAIILANERFWNAMVMGFHVFTLVCEVALGSCPGRFVGTITQDPQVLKSN